MRYPADVPRPLPDVRAAAATRRGPLHKENEDAWKIWNDGSRKVVEEHGRLFAVCDGVSTAGHGRMAARLTCERLTQFFEEGAPASLDTLIQLVSEVDWELRGAGGRAACTLSLLWIHGWTAHVLTVGDSPVHRLRRGRLTRAQDCSTMGGTGRRLRAYLGMGADVADVLCVTAWPIVPGDVFMVTSDGVTGVVESVGLARAWARCHEPDRCTKLLMSDVSAGDGEDDATVIVVQVEGVDLKPGLTHPQEAPDPPEYLNSLEEETGEVST